MLKDRIITTLRFVSLLLLGLVVALSATLIIQIVESENAIHGGHFSRFYTSMLDVLSMRNYS